MNYLMFMLHQVAKLKTILKVQYQRLILTFHIVAYVEQKQPVKRFTHQRLDVALH